MAFPCVCMQTEVIGLSGLKRKKKKKIRSWKGEERLLGRAGEELRYGENTFNMSIKSSKNR